MTVKERYEAESLWFRKVAILNLFHTQMKIRDKHWGLRQTSKYFDTALGTCSENIQLGISGINLQEYDTRDAAMNELKRRKEDGRFKSYTP